MDKLIARFVDGTCAGASTEASYLPLLVRVVVRENGTFQDLLTRDDTPKASERVLVYIAKGQQSCGFWDGRVNGRRVGGRIFVQPYRLLEPQPPRDALATPAAWAQHVEANVETYKRMFEEHERKCSADN